MLTPGPRYIDLAVLPDDAPGETFRVRLGDHRVQARLLSRGHTVDGGLRHDHLEVDAAPLLAGRVVAVDVARAQASACRV